jgi:hypothetical protein
MTQDTPDLFGHRPAQGDLFAGESFGGNKTAQVDPEVIRRRLHAMLAAVRSTKKGSPWTPETTRLNQLIFPQMANWLPESERDQLRFEFEAELKRLHIAA